MMELHHRHAAYKAAALTTELMQHESVRRRRLFNNRWEEYGCCLTQFCPASPPALFVGHVFPTTWPHQRLSFQTVRLFYVGDERPCVISQRNDKIAAIHGVSSEKTESRNTADCGAGRGGVLPYSAWLIAIVTNHQPPNGDWYDELPRLSK